MISASGDSSSTFLQKRTSHTRKIVCNISCVCRMENDEERANRAIVLLVVSQRIFLLQTFCAWSLVAKQEC